MLLCLTTSYIGTFNTSRMSSNSLIKHGLLQSTSNTPVRDIKLKLSILALYFAELQTVGLVVKFT